MAMQNTSLDPASEQNTVDMATQIEESNLSGAMKNKMHLVNKHLIRVQFGLPQYDLKGTQIWPTMSNFAFIFSILYYLVKGLWKKALVLLAIGIVINSIIAAISVLLGINFPFPVNYLGVLLISGMAMQSAYSDIYRYKILKQDFWW